MYALECIEPFIIIWLFGLTAQIKWAVTQVTRTQSRLQIMQ